ncbi:MAG: nucleotide exchange factor GrpE [Desulfovibrio sp.]|jgi:molecular chaperone GrpE|nr:nucleotide exchange factor GrpE [Desulfovibrio sp.]
MSARRTVFPPRNNNARPRRDADEARAYGDLLFDADQPASQKDGKNAARGRAAYDSTGGKGKDAGGENPRRPSPDEMPPYEASRSFNPLGDFPDDTLFPAPADREDDDEQQQLVDGDIPASLSDDTLAALCRERICPSCPEKKEVEEERLRAAADLDNARKRLAREREEQVRFAAEAVLTGIIPSLDNLDLALQYASPNAACKDFVVGVRMTRKLMGDTLAAQGLEQIGQVGDEFNPAVHEAVGTEDSPDVLEGHVCKLLTSGYKLRERLLRPARVMVCKKAGPHAGA